MRRMFCAFELLQQARLRKQQRFKPLLSFSFFQGRRLSLRFAQFRIFDLIRDRLTFPTTSHNTYTTAPSGMTALFGTMMMPSRMK